MSNSRRLRAAQPKRMPCAHCGHGIRAGKGVQMPDGRAVCDQCADTGILQKRLTCGCMGRPGVKVLREGSGYYCFQHVHPAMADHLTKKREG